jgi:hypothetical protein
LPGRICLQLLLIDDYLNMVPELIPVLAFSLFGHPDLYPFLSGKRGVAYTE